MFLDVRLRGRDTKAVHVPLDEVEVLPLPARRPVPSAPRTAACWWKGPTSINEE